MLFWIQSQTLNRNPLKEAFTFFCGFMKKARHSFLFLLIEKYDWLYTDSVLQSLHVARGESVKGKNISPFLRSGLPKSIYKNDSR